MALLSPSVAQAGFTETLPQFAFLLDESFVYAWVSRTYDNNGDKTPLVEELKSYEPGSGLQGILRPEPYVENYVLINQLQFGILDYLSLGVGIPVLLRSTIDPRFGWIPGDYQSRLGHAYTEEDFWEWTNAMGQPKPEAFDGNHGTLADMVVGLRYRFTDHFDVFERTAVAMALTVTGSIPTGENSDPEEVVAIGTTNWDLQSQGDLAFHLGLDKRFRDELDDRLVLGVDVFYETWFARTLTTPTGERHPLLLNYAPYVGKNYTFDPGDLSGFSVELTGVPYKGPAWGTWLVGHRAAKAESLPPIISLSARYTFVHLQQSDWDSDAPHWDWERERDYRPGYKNPLQFKAQFSFLRLGAPLQIYAAYRTLSLIPGKNARAVDAVSVGIQIPFKLWGFESEKAAEEESPAVSPGEGTGTSKPAEEPPAEAAPTP